MKFHCVLLEHKLLPVGQGGRPLSPLDILCLGLNIMTGGHYQKIGAIVGGMAQSTACKAINR